MEKRFRLVLLCFYIYIIDVNSQSCPPKSGAYMMHKGSCVANNSYFQAIALNGEGNELHCIVADTAAQPKWFFPNGSHMECGVANDQFSCKITSNSSILMYKKSIVKESEDTLSWAGVYSCCLFGNCNSSNSNRVTARIFDTKFATDFFVTLPKSMDLMPQNYTVHFVVEEFPPSKDSPYSPTLPFIAYYMEGVAITGDESIMGDHFCEQFPGVTCIHKHNPQFVNPTETPVVDSQFNVTWNASTILTIGKYFTFDNIMNGDHDIRCQIRSTKHNTSAYITIRAPNFTPSTPSLCVKSATSVTVDWMLSSFPPDADGYVIYYKSDGSEMPVKVDGGSVSQYTLEGLVPNTTYTITLRAYQDLLGPASESADVIITNADPVSDVAVVAVTSSSITVNWTPPTTNICFIQYFITYSATCPGTSSTHSGNMTVSDNHNSYQFQSLKGNVQYTFTITVVNLVGNSSITSINGTTKESAPSAPPQNIVITTSELSINIGWEDVECFNRNGDISGYIISVTGGDTSENRTSNTTNIEINGLMAFTQYNISVAAVNEIGEGPFSDPKIVIIGGRVGSLTVSNQGPTWILVMWTEPSNTNTTITEYEVAISKSISCNSGVVDERETMKSTFSASNNSYNFTGLHVDTCYMISVRAHSSEGPGEWTTIYKRTTPSPVVSITTRSPTTSSTSTSSDLVVGGVVACVIIVLVVLAMTMLVVVIVLRKSSTKFFTVKEASSRLTSPTCTYTAQTEMISLSTETQYAGEGPILSVKEPLADDELTSTYAEPPEEFIYAFIPAKARNVVFDHQIPTTLPVPLGKLGTHVAKCHTNENQAFLRQFAELYSGEDKSSVFAFAIDKKPLNRFKNIGPYDDNRVILKPLDHSGCKREYINASFIDGFSKPKKFIASQGPLKKTVNDFWRMVWQERPQSIVMVTNLIEGTKSKCEQYWPMSQLDQQKFGPFTVTLMDEQVLPDVVIRKMRLWLEEDSTHFHPITQYHFVSWPDHGVPSYPTPLVSLHKHVMSGWNPEGGPIVVHCSAGVGRTGTFIALDLALEQADRMGEVDIAGITNRLRQQRMKMVQTEDQYTFLHDVVLEVLLCGNTEVSSSTFAKQLDMLKMPNSRTGKPELETQFELLARVTPDPTTVLCKVAEENKEKNRTKRHLPVDRWRVILYGEHPGYIHASFIKGYKTKKAFIIAQSPMRNTVRDFWKMIMDNNVSIIVMLSPQYEESNEVCYQYWGSAPNSTEKFGEYYMHSKAVMEKEQLIAREMSVHKEETELNLTQFQILDWPADGKVRDTSTILEVIEEVMRTQQREGGGPVVVHCSDTVSRSGVYCAVTNALEQCKAEGVVDVFQAVKAIRMQKPGAVTSVEQYQSVFELVKRYLSMFETYANFQ